MKGLRASWLAGVAVLMGGLAPLAQAKGLSEPQVCESERSQLYAMSFQALGGQLNQVPKQLQSGLLMVEQANCEWNMGVVRTHVVTDPYPREVIDYEPRAAQISRLGEQVMVSYEFWEEATRDSKVDFHLALAPGKSNALHRLGFWRQLHLETNQVLAWGVMALEEASTQSREELAALKAPQCTREVVRARTRKPLGWVALCGSQEGDGAALLIHQKELRLAFGVWEDGGLGSLRLGKPAFQVKGHKGEQVELSFKLKQVQSPDQPPQATQNQPAELTIHMDSQWVEFVSPRPR